MREQIADRDLEAWLIVDTSASMRFGTTVSEKSQIALAAAAGVGFLTARNQNRLGAVLVAGPRLKVMPPRFGRDQVRAVLTAVASPPPAEGLGRADLVAAIDRVAVVCRRRGFVAVISDFAGETGSIPSPGWACATTCWRSPCTTPRARHAAGRSDRGRRSGDRPAARGAGDACGPTAFRRSGRGAGRGTSDTGSVEPAPTHRAGPPTLTGWRRSSSTSDASARAGGRTRRSCGRPMIGDDFLNPGRLWWLLAVAALAVAYVLVLRWRHRQGSASRRSTCSTASRRPGPDGAATSSPSCSSPGLPPVSSPSPARSRRRPNAPRARAASSCCSTSRCR